jgi:hypothetical protein
MRSLVIKLFVGLFRFFLPPLPHEAIDAHHLSGRPQMDYYVNEPVMGAYKKISTT